MSNNLKVSIEEQDKLYNEMFNAIVKQIIADYQSGQQGNIDCLQDLLLTNIEMRQLLAYLPEEEASKYSVFLLPMDKR
jgi:hypothetical protein